MKRLLFVIGALLVLTLAISPVQAGHRGGVVVSAGNDPYTGLPYIPNVPTVEPGCTVPPAAGTGITYYSDPVNGSDSNNGLSRATAFASLSQMISDGKFYDDNIHSGTHVVGSAIGDTLDLGAGNHGNVVFHGWNGVGTSLSSFDFPNYLTIQGDPANSGGPYAAVVGVANGASPYAALAVNAGKIAFRNFTVQSQNTSGVFTYATISFGPGQNLLLSSGTYDPTTGHIVLTFTTNFFFSPGNEASFNSLTGTGGFATFNNQTYTALSATSNSITFAGPTGQAASTITGGAFEGINEAAWLVTNGKYSHDTFYNGLDISSQSDAVIDTWSMQTWLTTRLSGILSGPDTTCTTISNNTLHNIGSGIVTDGDTDILIASNTIRNYVDDAIDHDILNGYFVNNDIINGLNDADGFHKDAIQGQPDAFNGSRNLEIAGNSVVRLNDPSERTSCNGTTFFRCPGDQQGIDAFDGEFGANWNVHDNRVITNSGDALAVHGVTGVVFVNDIALGDDGYRAECPESDDYNALDCSIYTGLQVGTSAAQLNAGPDNESYATTNVTTINDYFSSLSMDKTVTGWIGNTSGNFCIITTGAANCPLTYPSANPIAPISFTSGSYTSATGVIVITCPSTCPFTTGKSLFVYNMVSTNSAFVAAFNNDNTIGSNTTVSGTTITIITGVTGYGDAAITAGNVSYGVVTNTTPGLDTTAGTTILSTSPTSTFCAFNPTTSTYNLRFVGSC